MSSLNDLCYLQTGRSGSQLFPVSRSSAPERWPSPGSGFTVSVCVCVCVCVCVIQAHPLRLNTFSESVESAHLP